MNLSALNLSCRRGDLSVLSGVSFTLKSGDCLILRGPNGVGKSTLLRVLAGLSPFASGTLQADSDQIAYAGHLDAVKAQLTVAENLRFWAGIYGRGNAAQTAARFELTDLSGRLAQRLSAGQKRRLGLARLCLANRSIWLLDEPMQSLDAEHAAMFERAFADHCASGGIAVIASHGALAMPRAQTLDLRAFKPRSQAHASPFLEGFA